MNDSFIDWMNMGVQQHFRITGQFLKELQYNNFKFYFFFLRSLKGLIIKALKEHPYEAQSAQDNVSQ